jgi:hypothetical protein
LIVALRYVRFLKIDFDRGAPPKNCLLSARNTPSQILWEFLKPYSLVLILAGQSRLRQKSLAEMPMVRQSHIDEQIRDYLLQQERIDKARRQPAPLSFRPERRKWERRLGYFMLAGVAVVVFALNEYFHSKSAQVVLIVLGGGALAFLGALLYVHGVLWVTEKLGYRAELRSFKLTMASTGIVFFVLWAAWAYAVLSGR